MNEINISFKEIIDYIRDKDFEIESWRCKHLKALRKKQRYEEKLNKIYSYLNKRLNEYNNSDDLSKSCIGSYHYILLIDDLIKEIDDFDE